VLKFADHETIASLLTVVFSFPISYKETMISDSLEGGFVPDKNFLIFLGIVAVVLISLIPAAIKSLKERIKNQKKK